MLSLRKLILIAASLSSLNSCLYSDLGRTIGSIGTEVPRIVPKAATPQKIEVYCGQLYRKGNRYFVGLPVVWVPERRKGYEYLAPLSRGTDIWNLFETYNRPYTIGELKQYTPISIYFEATKINTVPNNKKFITHFKQRDKYGARGVVTAKLQQVTDFNPKEAEHLGLYGIDGAPHSIGYLEKRHTALHTCLLPVQMVARVIDIPLSLILMPLSAPIISYAPYAGWDSLEPYRDHSRPTSLPQFPLYPSEEAFNRFTSPCIPAFFATQEWPSKT